MVEKQRQPTAREKLLEAATSLIMRRGFPSAAVDDVCAAAGVSKGSFYHHFKSKEDLALQVLMSQSARACEVLESGSWRQVVPPIRRTMAFVDHVIEQSNLLWGAGCLVGVLAMDISMYGRELRAALRQTFEMLERRFSPRFEEIAAISGKSGPTASELARQLVRVIEGGAILSRSMESPEPVREALESFKHYLTLLAAGH